MSLVQTLIGGEQRHDRTFRYKSEPNKNVVVGLLVTGLVKGE